MKNDPSSDPALQTATIYIGGMTCGSCELLLERKLRHVAGVLAADIDHRTGTALITARSDALPALQKLQYVIERAGYTLLEEPPLRTFHQRKWLEIGGALVIVLALGKLLSTFNLVSLAPSTSGAITIGGTFLIGLVAGTSSCLAVTGGLLVSLAAKHNERHQAETAWQKFGPLLHFNIGRIISYFLLGGCIGLLGQSITLSTRMTGVMNIAVALVMLTLALQILKIIPKGSCPLRPPKRLAHWIADLSDNHHPAAPASLGALTFFLPCGFTQSLQLVALASGSFLSGALTMGIFALGTLPSLLGISMVSATARGHFSHFFLRFSGALVLILALMNLNSGLVLTGVDPSQMLRAALATGATTGGSAPAVRGGIQEISMRVMPGYYEPRDLTVRAGIPVRWTVDGTYAQGCTSVLVIPSMNIVKPLATGTNIIEFTPKDRGQLAFSCSMGMVRGTINVI